MGRGLFSSVEYTSRSISKGYAHKSTREVFKARNVNNAMNPNGVDIRESRDSEEHPNSLAIILGLDVTGSMGSIPHFLIKEGLPNMMDDIIKNGVPDPQVLFLAIGDHECDSSPLQCGQFESSDELLEYWLENVFLEGGGGGNRGESYHLAWYFAAMHTSIDCWEKRKQKGLLFTIGDEPVLHDIPKRAINGIMGPGQHQSYSHVELLDKAREMYDVYHLHLRQGSNGNNQRVIDEWKQLMRDNLIIIDRKEETSNVISDITVEHYKMKPQISEPDIDTPEELLTAEDDTLLTDTKEEMML